jgi:predicted acylesterase/phospholipase RssA
MDSRDYSDRFEPTPDEPGAGILPLQDFQDAVQTVFGGMPTGDNLLVAANRIGQGGPIVGDLLATHPFLQGNDTALGLEALLYGDNIESEWAPFVDLYATGGIQMATALVLAQPGFGDKLPGLAMRIGFGLDPENMLYRDKVFGAFGKHFDINRFGPKLPPALDRFEELMKRTCLVGVQHALSQFGIAAQDRPTEWTDGIITAIKPDRGCDGDAVEILGNGFGASQPPGVQLLFTAYKGGQVEAKVAPRDWSDTRLLTAAPLGVGNGPVGFVKSSSSGGGETLASAASQLAGEMQNCFGMKAANAVYNLNKVADKLGAPHVSSTGKNNYAGGPPRIIHFSGNYAQRVLLRPRGPLHLRWLTDNADSVTIQGTGSPQLPAVPSMLDTTGELLFPSVSATGPWTGSYTLTAKNPCGNVTQTITVEMRERAALVLAGGGAKGAFEVGAVRCLYDVFNFKPDLICGTSVGSLNAAKLAEGPGSLAGLESLWLGMQNSSDLFEPSGYVTRLVNNLASLGIKYVGGMSPADLLGVRLANPSWLSPDGQLAVGMTKNILGTVTGASMVFTIADLVFAAANAGITISKILKDLKGLIGSPSIFFFDPVRWKINANIDPVKIEKSGIELRIVVVNLDTGRLRYVDQTGHFVDDHYPVSLRDALQASASIPVAYPPTALPGGIYVDGGIRENAPAKAAFDAGASSMIVVMPSPASMDTASYENASFPVVAARSFDALFDETMQDDLSPFGGYGVPVQVIAPQIEPHSLFKVDPGLIQINMDYGYMRAYDEMQPDDGSRARLRAISLEIVRRRVDVWARLEHDSEGQIMDEELVSFSSVGLKPVPSSDSLLAVRVQKLLIRTLAKERQDLVKDGRANPKGVERIWQQWERHKWQPLIQTPWDAATAHVGPPAGAVPPPSPLAPP